MNHRARVTLALLAAFHLSLSFATALCYVFAIYNNWSLLVLPSAVVISTQVLFAVWIAMGSGNMVVRVPWVVLVLTVIWCLDLSAERLATAIWSDYHYFAERTRAAAIQAAIARAYVMFVLVLPFWALRFSFRWKIVAPTQGEEAHNSRYSMAEAMLGVTLVAVALGLGRLLLPPGAEPDEFPTAARPLQYWVVEFLVFIFVGLIAMPLVWLGFQTGKKLLRGVGLWYGVVAGLLVALITVVAIMSPRPLVEYVLEVVMFALLPIACAPLIIVGTLAVLRRQGFRLVRLAKGELLEGES